MESRPRAGCKTGRVGASSQALLTVCLGKISGLDEIIAEFQTLLSFYCVIKYHHLMRAIFALNMLFKRPAQVVCAKFRKPEFRPSR